MSSYNAETPADSFTNRPIFRSPFNPPHSCGQFLPLLHHNLPTSSQICHLLTPIPLIYNFSSSDTEQIKQILVIKTEEISFRKVERYLERVTPLLGNIMWTSQAAALVPQMRFQFSHPCTTWCNSNQWTKELHLNSQIVRVLCILHNTKCKMCKTRSKHPKYLTSKNLWDENTIGKF